jgi:hypothetical protein
MAIATVERRQHQRQEPQQQPQQSESTPHRDGSGSPLPHRESPRKLWQALAETQARKQSGKL